MTTELTRWEARALLHKLGGLTDYSRTAVERARQKLVAIAAPHVPNDVEVEDG